MQANIFLKEVLSKAEINDADVLSALESIQGEIPDSVMEVLPKLLTEKAAKSSKEVTAFFENKFNERLTKTQLSKLQETGFSESEIAEIKKLSPDERLVYIVKAERERAAKVNTASVDEKVLELEKKYKEAENKALAYQKNLMDKDKHYAGVIENIKMETDLNNSLSTIQLRKDGIPIDAAYKLIKEELRTQLDLMGASLQFVNGYPKLVRADDKSLDYYDDGNNLVDGGRFIQSVVAKLNLLEKAPSATNVQVGINQNRFNPSQNNANQNSGGRSYGSSSQRVSDFINKIKQNSK